MSVRFLIALAAIIMLVGCGEGRHGTIITGDGSLAANTPERAKARAEEAITKQVKQFQATVIIAPLPRWQDESRVRDEGWYWDKVQVDVTVPASLTPSERDTVSEAARRSIAGAVIGGSSSLLVVLHEQPVTAPVQAPMAAPLRQYTVQAGDTLAEISQAFYGTTQHWRVIVNANPGIDPATMAVGTVLNIPPKP